MNYKIILDSIKNVLPFTPTSIFKIDKRGFISSPDFLKNNKGESLVSCFFKRQHSCIDRLEIISLFEFVTKVCSILNTCKDVRYIPERSLNNIFRFLVILYMRTSKVSFRHFKYYDYLSLKSVIVRSGNDQFLIQYSKNANSYLAIRLQAI